MERAACAHRDGKAHWLLGKLSATLSDLLNTKTVKLLAISATNNQKN